MYVNFTIQTRCTSPFDDLCFLESCQFLPFHLFVSQSNILNGACWMWFVWLLQMLYVVLQARKPLGDRSTNEVCRYGRLDERVHGACGKPTFSI